MTAGAVFVEYRRYVGIEFWVRCSISCRRGIFCPARRGKRQDAQDGARKESRAGRQNKDFPIHGPESLNASNHKTLRPRVLV